MLTVNPTTNMPMDQSDQQPGQQPAAATDAARTPAADAQGRAERGYTPETTRKHIALYAMATEGLRVPDEIVNKKMSDAIGTCALAIAICAGAQVWNKVQIRGQNGLASIGHARAFRMLLGYLAGRFEGIEHDTMARDGIPLLHIAEIRMGIRDRNGSFRREWM